MNPGEWLDSKAGNAWLIKHSMFEFLLEFSLPDEWICSDHD